MRAYRIRVYGAPRTNIDPHQFAHAVLMLARELHQQQLEEQARNQEQQGDCGTDAGSADE